MNENSPRRMGNRLDQYMPTGEDTPQMPSRGPLIDVSYVRALVWRQRYVLIGITGLSLLLGVIATLLATPTYNASATARVAEPSMIIEGQDISDPYLNPNRTYEYMVTLGQIVTSRSMAETVADTMGLTQNPERIPGFGESAQDGAAVDPKPYAVSLLMGGVSTEIPTDSQVMTIRFSSTDRNFAAAAADAYVESLVLENITQGTDANAFAREYLEKQIADIRAELSKSEKDAIDYARANRILGEPLGEGSADIAQAGTAPTVTAAGLMNITQAYNTARARRIELEQRWRAVAGTPASQLPEVQNNVNIQTLRSSLAQQQSELADLRDRYRDDYPAVREAAASVSSLREAISAASGEVKNGIRNQYEIARRQEQGLKSELDRVSDETLDEQDRRVQYNFINREVGGLRDQLASLMQRYNAISSASNLRTSRVTLLDRAQVPASPSSPSLFKNLLIALVLGGGAAFLIAILREILDNRLHSIDDVESKLSLNVLGQTPYIGDDVGEEIGDHFSPISEAYSSIRASLDFALLSPSQKVIQITSSQPGEGKSTTCSTLARKYASVGKRVLLIDMDLRRPSMQKIFGNVRPKAGIVDVLYSRVPIQNAVIDVDVPNLDLLGVSDIPTNPVEILSSGLIPEFLERVRGSYDVILIDSSPVLGIADAPLLSRFTDAVVYVIEANKAHARQVRAALRRLQDMDANVVGAVVTKFRALDAGETYDYQYRYYTYSKDAD